MTESLKETHEWAKKKMEEWDALTDRAKTFSGEARYQKLDIPAKLSFENPSFYGDVVTREQDYYFHFFPTENPSYNLNTYGGGWIFGDAFPDCLANAFLAVFKHEDRLFWDYASDIRSWVVRCAGFADNPLASGLIELVLVKLKELYEK